MTEWKRKVEDLKNTFLGIRVGSFERLPGIGGSVIGVSLKYGNRFRCASLPFIGYMMDVVCSVDISRWKRSLVVRKLIIIHILKFMVSICG